MILFLLFFTFRNFSPKQEEDQNTSNLPDYYNFFDEYPECEFGNILSFCNASHVFTVLKAISHRFCRRIRKSIILSSSYILKCDIINEICHGGCQAVTYKFFERNGVSDINCHPWQQNPKNPKRKNIQKKSTANSNDGGNNNNKKQPNLENNALKGKITYDYQSIIDEKNNNIKIKNSDEDEYIETPNQIINNFFTKSKEERGKFKNFDDYLLKQYEKHNLKKENQDKNNFNSNNNELNKYSHSYCTKCQNESYPFKLYKTKINSTRRLKTVAEMKKAIFERGPITVTIATDNNFRNYKSGIYTSSIPQTTEAGDYTIELIGWGSLNSLDNFNEKKEIHNYNIHSKNEFIEHDIFYNDDSNSNSDEDEQDEQETQEIPQFNQYWIGIDNRNDNWGENGIIKILLGSNQGLIESFAYEADPE